MRSRSAVLAALAATAALVLAGCGGVGGGGAQGGGLAGATEGAGENDTNPLPRDQVQDGGDLRWVLDAIPDNFNRNQLDGTLGENKEVMDAVIPRAFVAQADGTVAVNEDYFTSIELTSQDPQVVTYTINPEATWDDGTPITWVDMQAQWQALNGTNEAFLVAGTSGYDAITSVERGVDDKQAVATFGTTFAEWKSIFVDGIYPASTNTDPATFNEGWINAMPLTAGPFRLETVDTTAQTITLVRNDNWWGEPAKLDRIIYRVVERDALADALANNEIDFYEIGSSVDLFQRAQGIAGVEIRQAAPPQYNHITFNGGPGAILADPALRRAVAQGIDRQIVATALVGQIVPDAGPYGSYLYPEGSENYVDHSAPVAFDPAAATAALDGLGWTSPGAGQVRTKDGQPLNLRFVTTAGNPISDQISQLVASQLTAIGVGVEFVPAASADLFDQYVTPGDFDMVGFVWGGTPFPVQSTQNIYGTTGDQNYGSIGTPEIDALYAEAFQELDDARRAELGNEIDELIWQQMPQLPLYSATGAYAVRSTLANFGARGNADFEYVDSGFTAG
ncbi:ABC transporter family substrate-binding protein [Pseudonocardia abyssalis]|uniref:ABC transporter family substrate-binding protein n=1 Tax=Pseudonocardia abyssalis TaxID=2792008 RepID=A0ABS6UVQ1_9PSEU|nr:ABC transporter family substrate-binding protein [Pseudonocardia abyssalis]MBW0117876.1 ABC transporter family substrate-binding protein [Pseudonocardia abyssalis]MBW0136336.1 ABC transporter family substrate-binding protein [Pseudonocardia abyssalis]